MSGQRDVWWEEIASLHLVTKTLGDSQCRMHNFQRLLAALPPQEWGMGVWGLSCATIRFYTRFVVCRHYW